VKIEHMGHKPDRGRSRWREGTVVGRPTQRGDRVAWLEAHSGLALVDVVLGPLLSEFHDFHDRILLCCQGVLPPHLFPIYLYAQYMERNTYPKRNRE
jgi:hypothetical protein